MPLAAAVAPLVAWAWWATDPRPPAWKPLAGLALIPPLAGGAWGGAMWLGGWVLARRSRAGDGE